MVFISLSGPSNCESLYLVAYGQHLPKRERCSISVTRTMGTEIQVAILCIRRTLESCDDRQSRGD